MRNVSQWSFRLMQEDRIAISSLFVTLTYDTDHVPISPKGFMTLDYTDVQKFVKRLRKLSVDPKGQPIRYFCVGEYGTKKMRPHYHLIMFNTNEENIVSAWSLDGIPIGGVYFGKVSGASVAYTLKYMMKQGKIPLHPNDDRVPEFRKMSKGLGANYLTPEIVRYHKKGENLFVSTEDIKIAMPRYYKERIWNRVELDLINVKHEEERNISGDREERKYEREYGKLFLDGKRASSVRRKEASERNAEKREKD